MPTGEATGISDSAFKRLRSRFRGALLRPGEEGYEEARRVWNGAINRHPALITRCAGADDVTEAVRFGRNLDLLISVKGGGHSVAGHGVCDGGLMIDLSLMKAISVDGQSRTAHAAGGVLWGELDRATQGMGLATTGGIISHTGIGGLTLGGGLGHVMRKLGLSLDNLLSVDLVTADAEKIPVSAETEPDLFWGLRGGGGNFGIATSFEYRLHPIGPMILGGPIFWPLEDASEVFGFVSDLAGEAPDELGITVVARLAPPMPFIPPSHQGKPIAGLLLAWTGDPEKGQEVLAPIRAIRSPVVDLVRPMPYLVLQSMLDGGAPHGVHYYWKSQRLPQLSDQVIKGIVERVESITSPLSQISGWAVGGAASRVDPDSTAMGDRAVGFEVNIVAAWPPPGATDADRHKGWVREGWENLRPHSTGVYANFLSDEDAAAVEDAYGARLAQLTRLKDRYDATNFFRLNANIEPTASKEERRSR